MMVSVTFSLFSHTGCGEGLALDNLTFGRDLGPCCVEVIELKLETLITAMFSVKL